ncbi:MAG: hypothetical protein ACE368_08440 [Paracoccaceae bacterium]
MRRDRAGPYLEILDPAGAVLPDDAPLLDSHDRFRATSTIGRAFDFRVEGEACARLPFSAVTLGDRSPACTTPRGKISPVQYRVSRWREERDADGNRVRVAAAWTIQEVSLVSIPADRNAKRRSFDMALDDEETGARQALIEDLAEFARLDDDWKTRMMDAGDELTDDEIRESAREEQAARQRAKPRIVPAVERESRDDPHAASRCRRLPHGRGRIARGEPRVCKSFDPRPCCGRADAGGPVGARPFDG